MSPRASYALSSSIHTPLDIDMTADLSVSEGDCIGRLLRAHRGVWRARESTAGERPVLTTGFPELDRVLGGGWPQGGVVDLLSDSLSAIHLVLPVLAALSRKGRRILWVAPPHVPYAPALAEQGLDFSRQWVIPAVEERDMLWSVEQGLRSGVCGAVLAWPGRLETAALRRFQLAAREGGALAFLSRARRWRDSAAPVALRLEVWPDMKGVMAEVIKRQGGWPSGPRRIAC